MAAKTLLVAVTSNNRPYVYDAPNVLSLPFGSEFRFRYQAKWTEEALRDAVIASSDRMKGSKVILVFHSEKSGSLVPLREAEVVRMEILGPVVYLRFRVGRFFNAPHSDEGEHSKGIAEATRLGRMLLSLPANADLHKPLPQGHYLRRTAPVDGVTWSNGTAAASWWGVVSILDEEPSLKALPFFHVLGLSSENGEQQGWTKLTLGRRYRLRVLEWCFERTRKPVARVECSSSPDLLVLEAASNMIVGPYDVVDFDLVATKPGKGQMTIALSMSDVTSKDGAVGQAGASADWPQSFHATIPVEVGPSWARLIGRFVLAVVGASLYLWLGPKVWPSNKDALQFIGLLLFVWALGSLGEKAVTAGKDVRELGKQPTG